MEKLALTIGNYTLNPPSSIPSGAVSPVGEKILTALINLMLGLALVLAVIFLVLGGIRWITSAGDPKGIEGARRQIIYAIIGIIIAGFAYAIVITVGNFFGAQLLPDASFIPRPFPTSPPQVYFSPPPGGPPPTPPPQCNFNTQCEFGEPLDPSICPDCPPGPETTCSLTRNNNPNLCWFDTDCPITGNQTCLQGNPAIDPNACTCVCNGDGICNIGESVFVCSTFENCPPTGESGTQCSELNDPLAQCWFDIADCQQTGLGTSCNQNSCTCF